MYLDHKIIKFKCEKVGDICLFKENVFSHINAQVIQETCLVAQNFKVRPNISTCFYY